MRINKIEQRSAGAPPDAWASTAGGYQPSTPPDALPITRDPTLAYLASLLLAALVAAASAAGLLLAPAGLYGTDPSLVPVFVGQDAANLLLGLPLLLGSLWLARRRSLAGLLLWPGALYYVLYTYVLYLTFGEPDPSVVRALTEASLIVFGVIGPIMTALFLAAAGYAILATGGRCPSGPAG